MQTIEERLAAAEARIAKLEAQRSLLWHMLRIARRFAAHPEWPAAKLWRSWRRYKTP